MEGVIHHNDVTVIGAGWNGLVACKYMLEEGLSAVAIEKKDGIGGVWRYSDDPNTPSVMQSTCCTSSTTVTEMSDYPIPVEMKEFPHHLDIMDYLESYAEKFQLMPHIKLNTQVTKVEKKGEIWQVNCSGGDTYTSSFLIIATGVIQKPNRELQETALKGYSGKVFHASEIKSVIEEYKGKRLLVLGGGETAADICKEWLSHSKFIYWSIPRGQHFFRKYGKVFRTPWFKAKAFDKATTRMIYLTSPYIHGKPGMGWACNWTTGGSLLAYQGHGIPEWKNDSPFIHFFINKCGNILDLIDYKHLVPKGGIVECKGKEVTFVDGTKEQFDIVIMSTGYKVEYPFLTEEYKYTDVRNLYKFIFDVKDPSLAFVGLVRPIIGSIVGIAELQSRLAARIYSKKVPLVSLEERRAVVKKDFTFWSNHFKHSSQRIQGLVEITEYTDDIAKIAGVYPDYWSLFKKNPRYWYTAYFSPYNAAWYRLNEPEHLERSIRTMERHKRGTWNWLDYLVFITLRLVWFNYWLTQLNKVKYRIQVSWWWPTVREWRVTRTLNYIWMTPKRFLFDNKSDETLQTRQRHLWPAPAAM